jgi:ribosome biogenesis GTPase A
MNNYNLYKSREYRKGREIKRMSAKAREEKIKREKEKDYLYQRLRLFILGYIGWVKLNEF